MAFEIFVEPIGVDEIVRWGQITEAFLKVAKGQVCKRLMSYGERIVKNWRHKPEFECVSWVSVEDFVIAMRPKGPNMIYWKWTSRGTPAHEIPKRPLPYPLRFPYQGKGKSYIPRTTVRGPGYGGPSIKVGPIRSFRQVHHPGTKARHFEEAWTRWAQKPFDKAMDDAMDYALEKYGFWRRRGTAAPW